MGTTTMRDSEIVNDTMENTKKSKLYHYSFIIMLENNRHVHLCDAWVRDNSDARSLAWHLINVRDDAVSLWYYTLDNKN